MKLNSKFIVSLLTLFATIPLSCATVLASTGTIVNNRTLVPVRGTFEELGLNVSWDGNTSTATISDSNFTISIKKGESTFSINGQTVTPEVPQQIINGSFYLPLRAIGDSIGAQTQWDNATKTAYINYTGKTAVVYCGEVPDNALTTTSKSIETTTKNNIIKTTTEATTEATTKEATTKTTKKSTTQTTTKAVKTTTTTTTTTTETTTAEATTETTTYNSSLATLAKQSKKYTDFPTVIDFGAFTNTSVFEVQYSYGDTCTATLIYKTSKISSNSISKYIELLTATGFTDIGATKLNDTSKGIYNHIFSNNLQTSNTSVGIFYGKNNDITFKDEPVITITISMSKDDFPTVYKSITALKGAHEAARYTQQRPVPDFGAYTGAKLIRVTNAKYENFSGTSYTYEVGDYTSDTKITNYISLCEKMGFHLGTSKTASTKSLLPNEPLKNPYGIIIANSTDGLMVLVYKISI